MATKPAAVRSFKASVDIPADSRTAAFTNAARVAIDQTDRLGDADTADLFTEVSRCADKYLYFLEAHLQG